jgi:hypothetical protein
MGTQGMIIIRPMETYEIDSVINLFNYYKDEAGISDERFDQNRLLNTLRQYNIRPNLFFRIAVNGLRPVGVIGGFLSEDPVEAEITATIQFNYLISEFNSVENYSQLIQEFETWSRQFKVEQIRALDIGEKTNRLFAVYDQLGFYPVRISIMNKEIE